MDIAEMYWSVFEMTGSVLAYLLYRHYTNVNDITQVPEQLDTNTGQ
ncbi:MAG TPA: YqzL family protein [Firmicutes bacterium]|jgi:hypothetical protein|nr:YqzL family protein [Bacillota bacterium]